MSFEPSESTPTIGDTLSEGRKLQIEQAFIEGAVPGEWAEGSPLSRGEAVVDLSIKKLETETPVLMGTVRDAISGVGLPESIERIVAVRGRGNRRKAVLMWVQIENPATTADVWLRVNAMKGTRDAFVFVGADGVERPHVIDQKDLRQIRGEQLNLLLPAEDSGVVWTTRKTAVVNGSSIVPARRPAVGVPAR